MINGKLISKILGSLLFIEGGLLLICLLLSLFYKENDWSSFAITIGLTVVLGVIFKFIGKNAEYRMGQKEGYFIVTISWIAFSFIGMLPYYIGNFIPSVTDAFFETMSGFTTTGASILNNIESLPHGILFWRSMTQWIGGLGIVFFTIAVIPTYRMNDIKLFAAEATGPTHDKVHPRIGVTAKWIWSIYLGLTLAEAAFLLFGGMNIFDSLCHSMTTTSTGGYSTRQGSIASYNSSYIEYVVTIFMFLSGINFTLLYTVSLKGKIRKFLQDTEFKWYLGTVLTFTAITAVTLYFTTSMGSEESFRKAVFQVVSLQTTTGFVSADYATWVPPLWLLLCITMIVGGCAGSTSGAIKCVRLAILSKICKNEFKRILHPNAVLPVRVNNATVSQSVRTTLLAFISFYLALIICGWFAIMCTGVDFMEAFGITVSSLGNVGPGLGKFGPSFSWSELPALSKWITSFLMLVGRLEVFSVLLVLTPRFWKR